MGRPAVWFKGIISVIRAILVTEAFWRTWFSNIRPAFFSHINFVREPLNALAKSVHVGILEDVDSHDYLVIALLAK